MKLFLTALLSMTSLASAHGVQQQLTYDSAANKISTRSLIYTSANTIGQPVPINAVTAQRGAYIEPLLFSPIGAGIGYYARPDFAVDEDNFPIHPTGPGPAWQYNDLLAGTGWAYENSTALPNLKGTQFGYQLLDGLKQWNGSSFVDPGNEQIQLILSEGTNTFTPTAANSLTTSDSVNGSLLLPAITNKSANPHSSISLRLLGDGVTLAGDNYGEDGVYVVKMAITTTAKIGTTPVGASDPLYFLLTKNASYAEGVAAASAFGIAPNLTQGQLPEPTAIAACAVCGLLLRRRRGAVIQRSAATKDLGHEVLHSSSRQSFQPTAKPATGGPSSLALLWMTAGSIAAPASLLAHDGPRVWIAANNGTLSTERSDDPTDASPTTYSQSQTFSVDLPQNNYISQTLYPGFEVPRDGSGDVPADATIGFKIAGPLLVANSAGDRLVSTIARYGASAPQMSVSVPGLTGTQAQLYTRFTSTGVVAGFNFPSPPEIGEHNHFSYILRGNGLSTTATSPDDTYVLPLVLTSPSLNRSEWFFITFNRLDPRENIAATLTTPLINARPGDANFDGVINFDDLVPLAQNYNKPAGQWWATGDFNFDGVVNFDDLVPLSQNYNKPAMFAADWATAQALVPEPMTIVIGLAGLLMLRQASRLSR